jgi:sugar lactone lactonase YvrE/glucose/arabinose dehydrogenase
MSLQSGRYTAPRPPSVAEGWSLERLTPPSRLFGANGLRTGPDGRIYVAQVTGSQISAVDLRTGQLETISPLGGEIIAPDDVAFDAHGNLYATEVMDGRVSVIGADRRPRVLRDDLPSANGITFYRGRLFIDECRPSGRLLELYPAGGAPRVLLDNIPLPNALEAGPDGWLYFPVMGANEIWRIDPQGGTPQRVAADLGIPDAVKFDAQGYIISTQVQTGQVLRIDPQSGRRSVLATLTPGLDNLTFVGDRLFVSNFDGRIAEVLGDGTTRTLLPGGLNWPLDLAVGADGQLYVADGTNLYVLPPGGTLRSVGMLFSPGYPGFVRGVAPLADGCFAVTTAGGHVALYRPSEKQSQVLADGLDQLYGVAVASGDALVVAELGAGRVLSVRSGEVRVLAAGLREPLGVTIGPDGAPLVSEMGAGRVVKLSGAGSETVLDGLQRPQGVLARGSELLVVDAGAKALIAFDLQSGARRIIAADLPVGAPPGVTPKPLRGLPPFSGPQGPFAGIAAGPDGTLYLSADTEGSVLALRPGPTRR